MRSQPHKIDDGILITVAGDGHVTGYFLELVTTAILLKERLAQLEEDRLLANAGVHRILERQQQSRAHVATMLHGLAVSSAPAEPGAVNLTPIPS